MEKINILQRYLQNFRLPLNGKKDLADLRQEWALPLTDYGCIFRIAKYSCLPYAHTPLVLMPLHSNSSYPKVKSSEYRLNVNLYPGVEKIGITDTDHIALSQAFRRAGYSCAGTPEDDCGLIPETLKSRTQLLPVLVDVTDLDPISLTVQEAISRLSESCAEALRLIQPLSRRLKQAQKNLYGDLSQKCAEMVNARTEFERDAKASIFWLSLIHI